MFIFFRTFQLNLQTFQKSCETNNRLKRSTGENLLEWSKQENETEYELITVESKPLRMKEKDENPNAFDDKSKGNDTFLLTIQQF